jgi:conjugative relaxase-like TrwC/TraI family protein
VISVHAIKGSPGAVADYYLAPERAGELEVPAPDGLGLEHPQADAGRETGLGLDPDYYVNEYNATGRWIGEGTRVVNSLEFIREDGPAGERARRAFIARLYGNINGVQVAKPVYRYDDDGKKVDVRVAAYDVTISAPKSVSTLMAVAPPEVAQKILAAHGRATTEAIGLLEQLSARAARGHHGDGQRAPRIDTDGFIGAAFDHTTSRANDPQLHTHVVIMNLVRGVDGRWSALDSRTLHRQATTASYLYQHLLRAELTNELGVVWTDVDRGVAEIAGVPAAVRREFSTRRAQIEAALDAEVGREVGPAGGVRRRARTLAAKAACLATRPAKARPDPVSLRVDWQQRATAKGFGPEQVAGLLAETHAPAPPDRAAVEHWVLSGDGATRERPTFDQGTVLRELIAALPPGTALTRDDLLAWTAKLMDRDELVPVPNSETRTFTTLDMLDTETNVLALASRSPDTGLAVVPGGRSLPQLIRTELRAEQRDHAQRLLGSGRPVEIVTGAAGSGKTRGLHAATSIWQREGVEVRGTAVAALTAQGLQDATGAASVSVTRLLNQPDQHLPARGVLLVDEAGMIGTRQLHRLLTLAEQHDCKVILVGDPAQLPELEAGGAFAALTRQPFALHLDGHGRQKQAWEQHALHDLRNGRTTTALDAYRDHDRLHLASSRADLLGRVVTDYLTARGGQVDPWQAAVLAPRRRDVTDLNLLIRRRLTADGTLGRRAMRVETPDGPRDYRKGDQVLVTRNHHDRQLLNGTRGTVRTVRRDGLVVQLTDGRRVVMDKHWLAGGDLDHGYAMTLHKAQGRTVHTALVLGDESLSQEGGYVGLSRGTSANHLYLDTATDHALRDCHDHEPTRQAATPLRSRTRALARSTQQALAREVMSLPAPTSKGLER